MKRLATAFLTVSLVVLFYGAVEVRAQEDYPQPKVPSIFMFESLATDTVFFNNNYGEIPDTAYFNFDVLPGAFGIDPVEGDSALVVDYQIYAPNSWGGSMGMVHGLPDGYPFYDLSDFTEIHLSYYVLQPADPSLTFRLKLHDASQGIAGGDGGGSTNKEDWNSEDGDLFQAIPGWNEYVMPLEDLGLTSNPLPNGFSRPGCSSGLNPEEASGCWSGILGNEKLDLDMISGISFEFFAGDNVHDEDSLSAGVIAFDKMYVSGVRYDLLSTFDDPGAVGGWVNGSGSRAVSAYPDGIEGAGAVELDYHFIGDLSWGGSVDNQITPAEAHFGNWNGRTHLSVFYKVTEAMVGEANLVFKLFDDNTGVSEEWQWQAPPILTEVTDTWQRLLIPFDEFAIPSWIGDRGDEELTLNSIKEVQFQVIGSAGGEATGKVAFDRLTTYGFQITDLDPPEAVAALNVIPGQYSNTISWSDVPGEDGETYDLFYSLSPITDVEADGVYSGLLGISENTEVFSHEVYTPISDQPITYYYAIRPSDAVGNLGPITTTGAVENTGMGIQTISLETPVGFAPDGDLSEWGNITPIHLEPEGALGHVPDGFGIDNANDLSADVYLAVDNEAIYLALSVTDDILSPVPDGTTESRWLYDGAELYIGLYNEIHTRHANSRASGDELDYKFYLYKQMVHTDHNGTVAQAADGNFSYTQTASGWTMEAKLEHANYAYDGQALFAPRNGMRIPFDFVVMDNDEPGTQNREGILAFSNANEDNAHNQPRNWGYNWIGDQIVVAVEQIAGEIPSSFELYQNYPNPFNPSTVIRYELPSAGEVELSVFNTLGQRVRTLVNRKQNAGTYEVTFNAASLASGLYFYRIRSGNVSKVKKMILLR